jgi:hypothetical protein
MFACVKILSLKALYNTEFYDPPNVNIYNHRTIILFLFQFKKLFTHSEYEIAWTFIYNESTLDDFLHFKNILWQTGFELFGHL